MSFEPLVSFKAIILRPHSGFLPQGSMAHRDSSPCEKDSSSGCSHCLLSPGPGETSHRLVLKAASS